MIQETSRAAYAEMVVNGEINRRQASVLRALMVARRPVSNREIAAKLGWEINRVTGRVLELRTKGVVEHAGYIEHDGRIAMTWRLK